jgi:hypothetical protein
MTLTEVSRRIAATLGRSPEAVRYTIKNFDRVHPDYALFPAVVGPLSAAAKEQIIMAMTAKQSAKLTGDAVEDTVTTIAKRFGRTRSSMYRLVNEVRAKDLVEKPVDYIHNPEFDDPQGSRDSGRDARSGRLRGEACRQGSTQGCAAADGAPVRVAAAHQGAGTARLPEDELPEA